MPAAAAAGSACKPASMAPCKLKPPMPGELLRAAGVDTGTIGGVLLAGAFAPATVRTTDNTSLTLCPAITADTNKSRDVCFLPHRRKSKWLDEEHKLLLACKANKHNTLYCLHSYQ